MVDLYSVKQRLMHSKTGLALPASFLFFCLLIAACTPGSDELDSARFSGQTMGTSYHITLVADSGDSLDTSLDGLQQAVDDELVKINQMMSTYIPDSELMRFNRVPVDQWQGLSEPLLEVFAISQEISEKSRGAFDITVGPLVNLWGFGPDMRPHTVPDGDALLAAHSQVGYEYLQVDATQARRLRDISVDLSSVAKGYGVDWIAAFLADRGYQNYMVEIGGEVRVAGVSPRNGDWRIAVEQPSLLHEGSRLALELKNQAVATSGDYRNYFEAEGVRFSHTIDPATGKPITHNLVSVTVIADTAAKADAWATALNVMGPEKGLALANAEQLAVYMVVKTDSGFADIRSVSFSHLAP